MSAGTAPEVGTSSSLSSSEIVRNKPPAGAAASINELGRWMYTSALSSGTSLKLPEKKVRLEAQRAYQKVPAGAVGSSTLDASKDSAFASSRVSQSSPHQRRWKMKYRHEAILIMAAFSSNSYPSRQRCRRSTLTSLQPARSFSAHLQEEGTAASSAGEVPGHPLIFKPRPRGNRQTTTDEPSTSVPVQRALTWLAAAESSQAL